MTWIGGALIGWSLYGILFKSSLSLLGKLDYILLIIGMALVIASIPL